MTLDNALFTAFVLCRYNVKFTQWCGTLTRMFGHRATAPIKTFIDQV